MINARKFETSVVWPVSSDVASDPGMACWRNKNNDDRRLNEGTNISRPLVSSSEYKHQMIRLQNYMDRYYTTNYITVINISTTCEQPQCFERLSLKLVKVRHKIVFNKTCIREGLLPTYTNGIICNNADFPP